MKKEAIIILFFLIVLTSFTFAEETTSSSEDISKAIKDATKSIADETSAFDTRIPLPLFLQPPVSVLFNLDADEPLTIENLVLYVSLIIVLFTIIYGTILFIPGLDKKAPRIIASLAITLLMTMTGVIKTLIFYLIYLINFFDWIQKLGNFQIVLAIILAILIFLAGRFVSNSLNNKLKKEKANKAAENAEILSASAKAQADAAKKLTDNNK